MTRQTTARREKSDRRALLLRTAEDLFARKGIDAVSLNEINKAAGQRNTSAMHYHFGNKDGLVQTIIYDHYATIDRDINSLLDAFEQLPLEQRTARGLLHALVTPFVQQLDHPRGINYLLIVRQVLVKSSDMLISGHPEGEDAARLRVFKLSRPLLPQLPASVQRARMELCAGLLFNVLATRAQSEQTEGLELFVSQLLDNLEAVLTNPPSAQTLDLLAGQH